MTAVTPCPWPTKSGLYICQRPHLHPFDSLEAKAWFWGPLELAEARV